MLLQFWRGTPGDFKSPLSWPAGPGKNLVPHPRIDPRNLCSHSGLTEISLGEEGWGCAPFVLLSSGSVLPHSVPRCADGGLEVVSPQGCPSL